MSPAFGFGLSLEDQNAEMRCMVNVGFLKDYLFRPLKKNKEWAGIGVVRVQGQNLAVFGPCAGRPCPGEAGRGGGMLLWVKVGCCWTGGLRNGGREVGVGGWSHSLDGGGRVPG